MKNRIFFFLIITLFLVCPVFGEDSGQPGFGVPTDAFQQESNSNSESSNSFDDLINSIYPDNQNNHLDSKTYSTLFSSKRNQYIDYRLNFHIMDKYTLTPGDIFTLTIDAGERDNNGSNDISTYKIQLKKDYTINVPYLGIIDAKKKNLPELQDLITTSIRDIIPVLYVDFILTSPAQFNVFVYGGVNLPQSITATPLLRLVDAIPMANGLKPGGSYRQVKLIRDQHVIIFDLSKYYSKADFSSNPALRPGDLIFISKAEIIANIAGKVRYPGSYELIAGETLKDLIAFAGGTIPGALISSIEVSSIDNNGVRIIKSVSYENASDILLYMGDSITVRSTSDNCEMITCEGAVFGKRLSGDVPVVSPKKPVRVEIPYYPGISLLAVLDSVGGPTPYAVLNDSFLLRKSTEEKISIDINNLWKNRDIKDDLIMQPGDYLLIPIEKMEIFVTGMVLKPGAYMHTNGYTVSDYLLLAGGIDEIHANKNSIYKIDEQGNKIRLSMTEEVKPGTNIHVDRNLLYQSDVFVNDFLVAAGWVTAITGLITVVIQFIQLF